MKRAVAVFGIALFAAFAQAPLAAEASRAKRAPVWVYLETVPGNLSADELAQKKPPIQEISDLARFLMGGMIYGWKFTYTPSDKARAVMEYFEFAPVKEISRDDPRFTITELTPAYPKLNCWANFTLDDSTRRWEMYWDSVLFKSSNGRGKGERKAEIAGVRNAYMEAVKDAVRSYARLLEKNKPKEIRGEVLLRDNPRLFADQGWFVADIKVLINIQELTPYTSF
jgi:hypothetical protein